MPRNRENGQLDSVEASDIDTFFLSMNARLRANQLQPGQVAMSINGRMGLNGEWQPRNGVTTFGPVLSTSAAALTIPFYLYANKVIIAADRVTTTVTIQTSTTHGFVTGSQVGIDDISGTVDPTGNRVITSTGADTFTFQIAGATGSESYVLGGSPIAGAPFISSEVNAAYGSCRFSDPSDNNDEYIILALNNNAVAVSLIDESIVDIEYPAGTTVTQECDLLQAFGKVYLFRKGQTTLEWNGDLTGSPAFTKVANGSYTQPLVLTTATNTACTAGVVTVTNTHNLTVGDIITIFDGGSSPLIDGAKYVVATTSTTVSFTFYASVDDFSATSVVCGIEQSDGRGFTHMPAPEWGVYHQRRMICPFSYTTTGSSGSETVTARDIADEFVMSDVMDSDTYDVLQNQFRVTGGIADYLKAFHPFTDDAAIAFNRNSLHLVTGLLGSTSDVSIKEITREVGLVARKSVVTIGNAIFFLSDNGIYAAEFGDLYNLRGAKVPLSDPIDSIIKRINPTYAHRAVAVFHDNRYRIAVPLDDSVVNNAILVYNVLNAGWESVDQIDQLGWDVSNFIVGSPEGVMRLFAVNSFGGLHLMDDRIDDSDRIYTYPGVAAESYLVASELTTRQYTLGSISRKKFNSFELHVISSDSNTSNATIFATTEDLDVISNLGTIYSLNDDTLLDVAESASFRGRIGNIRAHGLQLIITPTAGRPRIRVIKITGKESFRATTKAI